MKHKHALFTPEGGRLLRAEYAGGRRSMADIARGLGVYPNLVRRALLHHGIVPRTHSEAQAEALRSGRHPHPTRGRKHTAEARRKISRGLRRRDKESC